MTTTTTPPPRPEERPGDPRPAFERVAAAWLAREVDGGQHLDPAALAREVSVTPRTAAATLAALRASRERDPSCGRVRMLLARDRIQQAFVAAELRGDGRLDAASLAREAGVTTTVARQWLRAFRAARHGDPGCAASQPSAARPPRSSLPGCRPPTRVAADPISSRSRRRITRWSASSSSTTSRSRPTAGALTRPRSPARSALAAPTPPRPWPPCAAGP